MKSIISILLILIAASICHAQNEIQNYFQGFEEEISGKRFGYHSPLPDVTNSLLLRGQSDYEPLVWKTGIVPDHYKDPFVHFIWLFGMDVHEKPVDFHLHVNGKKWISFQNSRTSDLGERSINGVEGSSLILNTTMLDKYNDQMGFAILKIPTTGIKTGQSNEIRISTDDDDNNAWYMTFRTEVEEGVEIYQNKVVVRDEGKLYHSVSIDFIHVGDDSEANVHIGSQSGNMMLKAGFNKLEMNLPKVELKSDFEAEIRIKGKKPIKRNFTLEPVKEWEIYLVQHTHTDIGYTRPQTEILPEHLRYIDHALDFCDQTDHYPDAAKFRWTCETSWSVREYLKSRPQEQIDRLIQRIKEGRIEATGMFLNYSEIVDEAALAVQTKTLRMLKNSGIDVTTAMQNDVNGIAWCMVDNFHNTDVKYLNMGIHAHRARKPFNKPTTFWWQSPAGNRLLAYRSEHYQHANSLSLTTGQQDVFRTNLSKYLTSLENRNYPYDKVALQFSGYITDNSPPSTKACDVIRDWNEKYEWPKLRSALARDFLLFLDEQHADDIPEQVVAWPDWWTDGVGSAANETKIVRNTHAQISAITNVMTMGMIMGAEFPKTLQDDIQDVYDNLLFYDEHTHGAAESISDPLAQNTINQWGMKSAYAWEAAKKAHSVEEQVMGFVEPLIPGSDHATITVFNTLNWTRSGQVNLFIQHAAIPEGVAYSITDEQGIVVPSQVVDRRMEGAYYELWVADIPPLGYKTLRINLGIDEQDDRGTKRYALMENDYYIMEMDEQSGLVKRIYDKKLEKELLDPEAKHSFGQFIYEQLDNRHEMERLTNSNRDTVYRPLGLNRETLQNIKLVRQEDGPIYSSVFLNAQMPVCADERGIDIEIRLFHFQKKIELHYRMFKLGVQDPEAVYVAFPFKLERGRLAFEAQGGVVYPGKNQLEGTSSDWNTIQNFASVRNRKGQILFVSKDIPLVHFGDINTGRYYYRLKPKTNHIYSWVLNNYWVTNFKASQEGELRWSYSITSSDDSSDQYATQFGWGERAPFLSRVKLSTKSSHGKATLARSVIDLGVPNLLLVDAAPAMEGNAIVLHLREVEGGHAILDIEGLLKTTGATSATEVNVLEEELRVLNASLRIDHYGSRFVRLDFE